MSRDFKGFPSLKEVECWGGSLEPEVKLLSLQLYSLPERTVLASLNVLTKNCVTFGEYSSCVINSDDTHKSRLRILVYDLVEGEGKEFGCTANSLKSLGNTKTLNWSIRVTRKSEWV